MDCTTTHLTKLLTDKEKTHNEREQEVSKKELSINRQVRQGIGSFGLLVYVKSSVEVHAHFLALPFTVRWFISSSDR
jgi:hypothetical protein